LRALEAKEVSLQEHAINEQHDRARKAIEGYKARAIQRAWRRVQEKSRVGQESGAADEMIAMYRERLDRFRSTQAMKQAAHCLFCGVTWDAGHARNANGQHWTQKERFGAYEAFVCTSAAPLLAQLDAERAYLQQEEEASSSTHLQADERAETVRFEALHEIERAYSDLNRCMDDMEARQAWAPLDGLRSAAEFAQLAVCRAEAMRTGTMNEHGKLIVATDGDEDSLLPGVEQMGSPAQQGVEEEVDDDDDDDDDALLTQMVAAQARKAKAKPSWQRGGNGGKGGKGKLR